MDGLDRFLAAQDGVYSTALAELRTGAKRSHWMWFVFPQIAGLGQSPTARRFAIRDLVEARSYLAHEVLGPRLREATAVTAGWATKRSLLDIFGHIDSLKFTSCMTLFEAAAGTDGPADFTTAIAVLADGMRDRHTLSLLAAERPPT